MRQHPQPSAVNKHIEVVESCNKHACSNTYGVRDTPPPPRQASPILINYY